jgi:hypothetical protein
MNNKYFYRALVAILAGSAMIAKASVLIAGVAV